MLSITDQSQCLQLIYFFFIDNNNVHTQKYLTKNISYINLPYITYRRIFMIHYYLRHLQNTIHYINYNIAVTLYVLS